MSFKIERNDITKVHADAIVNTANPHPIIGGGTDFQIYQAAGENKLFAVRRKIGEIERGKSVATPAFNLSKNGVKYIIHTVGIRFKGGQSGEEDILRSCYSSSLNLAASLKCKSVALPLLATGNYDFPKELGLRIACEEINDFLLKADDNIDVILVVFNKDSYLVSEKLFGDIENFLSGESYATDEKSISFSNRNDASESTQNDEKLKNENLDDFINHSHQNLNFQNTLQKIIADKNLANSQVYKKAQIDKKFFSKIISTKNYVPKKHAVMALGLALELSPNEFEKFLASAGYAFMPSSTFDLIIKFCVMNKIYNLIEVDMILDSHNLECFAPK